MSVSSLASNEVVLNQLVNEVIKKTSVQRVLYAYDSNSLNQVCNPLDQLLLINAPLKLTQPAEVVVLDLRMSNYCSSPLNITLNIDLGGVLSSYTIKGNAGYNTTALLLNLPSNPLTTNQTLNVTMFNNNGANNVAFAPNDCYLCYSVSE